MSFVRKQLKGLRSQSLITRTLQNGNMLDSLKKLKKNIILQVLLLSLHLKTFKLLRKELNLMLMTTSSSNCYLNGNLIVHLDCLRNNTLFMSLVMQLAKNKVNEPPFKMQPISQQRQIRKTKMIQERKRRKNELNELYLKWLN